MDIAHSDSFDQLDTDSREKRQRVHLDDYSNGTHCEDDENRLYPKSSHPSFSKKIRLSDNDPQEVSNTSYDDNRSPLVDLSNIDNRGDNQEDDEVIDEEPDWEKLLGESEPAAKEQIELFLRTREIRDEADETFSAAMDECNIRMEEAKKKILQAAADMHNFHRERLDNLEVDIKHTVVWNHQLRTKMKKELEETRSKAQGLFSQLLMSVSQPLELLRNSERDRTDKS